MKLESRSIAERVRRDLDRKIVLISGPRQSGKTTLARALFKSHDYSNFDSARDRLALSRGEWDRKADLLVLDELHKKVRWKTWLKGAFDTEGVRPRLLVTGSAQRRASWPRGASRTGA